YAWHVRRGRLHLRDRGDQGGDGGAHGEGGGISFSLYDGTGMSLSITKELESSLRLAFAEAKARRHEHVTLEHLLYALLRDPVASRILRACGARMAELRRELEEHLERILVSLPPGVDRDPEQTRAFARVLERAAMQVQSSGKAQVDGGNVP